MSLPVSDLGTILSIWAHPDDEVWTSAGLMLEALENNQRVVCVTATSGEHGVQDPHKWPESELKMIRRRELGQSLKYLGPIEHHFLNFEDGTCKDVPEDIAIDCLLPLIKEIKPDTILTFEPRGITGHPDHVQVSKWCTKLPDDTLRILHAVTTKQAYDAAGREMDEKFDIFMNLKKPKCIDENEADVLLELNDDQLERKLDALRAHESQMSRIFEHGVDLLRELVKKEAYIFAQD